jgi:hypothetical protein
MAFACPECMAHRSLRITARIELPPDSRSDEITLQIIKCARCGFAGAAVYEESRRGALDSESFDHRGYCVGQAELSVLRQTIRQCRQPGNRRCDCAAHHALGQRDIGGRWIAPEALRWENSFAMRR